MEYAKLQIENWQTICSDVKELWFFSLVDKGPLIFTVRDATHAYEFTFERSHAKYVGPYMLVDEALRAGDKGITPPVGWTFIIKNSDLKPLFNPGLVEVIFDNQTLKHYVVSTNDFCLEILNDKEPIIRKYLIEKE